MAESECSGIHHLPLCCCQFGDYRQAGRQHGADDCIHIHLKFRNRYPLSTVGPGCYVLWQNLINSFELWHYQKKHGVR